MSPNPQQTPTEPASHTVNTRNFGPLTVREDKVITFIPGLLGFTSLNRYVLIERRQESPFLWLQSLDNPELAFVVIDPAVILRDYRPGPARASRREWRWGRSSDFHARRGVFRARLGLQNGLFYPTRRFPRRSSGAAMIIPSRSRTKRSLLAAPLACGGTGPRRACAPRHSA